MPSITVLCPPRTGTALALLKSGRTAMVSAPSPALPGLLVPPVSKTVR